MNTNETSTAIPPHHLTPDEYGMTSLDYVRHWESVCSDLFDETRACAFDAAVQRDLTEARAELRKAIRVYERESTES